MAGVVDVDWEEVYLYLDSDSDNAEEVPGLASDDDDVKELSLLSEESKSSPAKPNLRFQPNHVTAEVEGHRDRGRDLVMYDERGCQACISNRSLRCQLTTSCALTCNFKEFYKNTTTNKSRITNIKKTVVFSLAIECFYAYLDEDGDRIWFWASCREMFVVDGFGW
jgi:hypothetical protein